MPEDRLDLRRIDLNDLFPWWILFRGFRLASDPKKIVLASLGAVLMSVGWHFISSAASIEEPTPLEPLAAEATQQERETYQRELDAKREKWVRYKYLSEAHRLPWQSGGTLPEGIYVSALDREKGWTNFGIEIPASFFLVIEPIRALILPAQLTFVSRGSTGIGLLLLIWTLLVWSLFGAAICRISAVQVARGGNVGLIESFRFVLARYLSFCISPVLPFFGIVLIIIFCVVGAWLLFIPGIDILVGIAWVLPLLASFVIVAALLGLALGWPLMYAAIGAEATESFDALSRAFSYVVGRPWNYLYYAACSILYGGIIMIFVVTFVSGVVTISKYSVSWGYSDVSPLYAFAPDAPGWRAELGPAPEEDSLPAAMPMGTKRITALFVGFWTHLVFIALVGFTFSFFWSEVTVIYFLLRRDVDETEIEEVYLEEEDEEPFPTATPTVAPPKPAVASAGPATPGTGTSLPIIDPPTA